MGLSRLLLGLMAVIAVEFWVASSALACSAPPRLTYERIYLPEVIFKGRLIAGRDNMRIPTFATKETYKGEVRDEWTVRVPFTLIGPELPVLAITSNTRSRRTPLEYGKLFIVGLERSKHVGRKITKSSDITDDRAQLKHLIQGGICNLPFLFEYSEQLDRLLKITFSQLGTKKDAQRERLLRLYFGFGKLRTQLTQERSVENARRVMQHAYDRDKNGFSEEDIAKFYASERSKRWSRPKRKELEQALSTFDSNGDSVVSYEELAAEVRKAYRFYDRNGDGLLDGHGKQ